LASALSIQIATNLFNDAIDARKGADTERRLGPVRVTASGRIPAAAVLRAAVAACVLAALCGLPLVLARGPVILGIGLVSLLLTYGYTGGPVPLAYRGLGELFVIAFFGFAATAGSYFVQTGAWPGTSGWIAGFQVGLLATVLIAINNLRDRDEDATTGKRTLAVRFGIAFARGEIAACGLLPYVLGPLAWPDRPWAAWLPAAGLPLAAAVVVGVFRQPPGPSFNRWLALGGMHLVLWMLLFAVALEMSGRA
jgi:1,4-dihydroxy-2-naphthoate octaprenyltransferase